MTTHITLSSFPSCTATGQHAPVVCLLHAAGGHEARAPLPTGPATAVASRCTRQREARRARPRSSPACSEASSVIQRTPRLPRHSTRRPRPAPTAQQRAPLGHAACLQSASFSNPIQFSSCHESPLELDLQRPNKQINQSLPCRTGASLRPRRRRQPPSRRPRAGPSLLCRWRASSSRSGGRAAPAFTPDDAPRDPTAVPPLLHFRRSAASSGGHTIPPLLRPLYP